MELSRILGDARVVPVVTIEDVNHAVPLAETLLDSGISIIEVTLRTPVALDAIKIIAGSIPEMMVGAGSVGNSGQMRQASDAGARFAVSPGGTASLVAEALRLKMPYIPGAATPSEMLQLLEQGFSVQKFFPAEIAGGIDMLRAIEGPIPGLLFMPTGGITAERTGDYLALPNVVAVGCSWVAPTGLINAGDFKQIGCLAAQALQIET